MKLGQAVAVLLVDGQLGPLAWSFGNATQGARLGAVRFHHGPLEAGSSVSVESLQRTGLLTGELIASEEQAAEPGQSIGEAIEHAFDGLGWDAVVCLPCAGANRRGEVGLRCADAALTLSRQTLAVAEMSSEAGPSGGQHLSERTLKMLDLLSEPVTVALPAGIRSPVGRELRAGLRAVFDSSAGQSQLALGVDRPARIARHDWRRAPIDLVGFASAVPSAAPTRSRLLEDPLLFASALAAGNVLAQMLLQEDSP